jgi:hypothetical protein
VRSPRFEVLRRLHAIDATRVHRTMTWMVSFSNLGPRRETAMFRAGSAVNGKHYKASNHPITFHNTEVEKFLEARISAF